MAKKTNEKKVKKSTERKADKKEEEKKEDTFVGFCASGKAKIFHKSNCRYIKKIKQGNEVTGNTPGEVINKGRKNKEACLI